MRKIIHLDMDCFFAAVEMRENPSLRGKPVAVGGSASKRGVISTANYEARKYGVRSAMASAHAMKLCPQLILLRHSGHLYREASEIVMDICQRYTDKMQSLSLDEAYLDVTNSDLPRGSATLLAQRIRQEIFAATQLTASAGIAPNKLLAKLACERNKPDGQFTVSPDKVMEFMTPLPLGKIHGVGKVTAHHLAEQGFRTCADILTVSRFELVARLGNLGGWLYEACRGIDEREVCNEWERKSLSNENTFPRDLTHPDEMRSALSTMVEELAADLTHYPEKRVHGLVVKIKYHDFKQTTIERAGVAVSLDAAWSLFRARWESDPRPVRLIGVGVKFAPEEEESAQLSFDALDVAG